MGNYIEKYTNPPIGILDFCKQKLTALLWNSWGWLAITYGSEQRQCFSLHGHYRLCGSAGLHNVLLVHVEERSIEKSAEEREKEKQEHVQT